MMTELNEMLERLKQRRSQSPQRIKTSHTSGDEIDTSNGHRKIHSKKTLRMEKVYGATEFGKFFVTRPTNAVNKPSNFYYRVCRKDVSVLTQGHHEVFRHFQGSGHFARDQRLPLGTPAWRLLDFRENPFSEDELEQQNGNIKMGPLVLCDCEHPFA